MASNEQQVPITSFTDSSNQWSGYQDSSALKQQQQPFQTQTFTASNDLLTSGGYGQQQQQRALAGGYGSQQETANTRLISMPQTFVR